MGPALEIGSDEWSVHFEVNARSVFTCSRLAVKRLIEQGGGGRIVNVASNAGKVGYPNMAAYNASKAAVISLTRALAAEWAEHGINVNAVCPGGVETPMLSEVAGWIGEREGVDPAELLRRMRPAQLGRHVQPIEVGRVVAFLLSERAAIIRGHRSTSTAATRRTSGDNATTVVSATKDPLARLGGSTSWRSRSPGSSSRRLPAHHVVILRSI